MLDVHQNESPKDEVMHLPSGGADQPLLQACEQFKKAVDFWRLLMNEGNSSTPPCGNLTFEDIWKANQQWRLALAQVRSQPADTLSGLGAKRQVLQTLSHFGDSGDPTFFELAVELTDEYHRFVSGPIISSTFAASDSSGPEVVTPRSPSKGFFKLNYLLGIFSS